MQVSVKRWLDNEHVYSHKMQRKVQTTNIKLQTTNIKVEKSDARLKLSSRTDLAKMFFATKKQLA